MAEGPESSLRATRSRDHMKGALLAVVLIVAACGQPASSTRIQGSPSPTPAAPGSPQPSTQPASGLLFAAVESSSAQAPPDTVVIIGLDGYARATAKFQSRQRPYIGNAAVPMQGVAQVVGSGVYYIDGSGTVRVLRAKAQPQVVASFPQQPIQYETWFAVSPDGGRVLAGVLQYPDMGPVPSPCTGMCLPALIGPWKFSLQAAHAGGASTVLNHSESTTHPDAPGSTLKPIFPVGWTSAGPIAMLPVSLGTQDFWPGGPLYVIDGAGNKGTQVGGSDCRSASITPNGVIPCISSQGLVEVRNSAGLVIWATKVQTNADSISLSPDLQALSDGSSGTVETRNGASVQLPVGFRVEGWLNGNTLVGRVWQPNGIEGGNLSWISLGDPGTVHDLGFKGDFVAPLA